MRRLTPVWIFIILFVAAVIYLPGISKYLSLKRKQAQLSEEIKRLENEIESLRQEEHLLTTNMAHLEEVMRSELGLVKPGEVIYRIVEEPTKSATPKATSSQGAAQEKPATPIVQKKLSQKTPLS